MTNTTQGKTLEEISVLFEKESAAHEAHLREQQHQRSLSHSHGSHHSLHSQQEPSCCGRYQTTEVAGLDDDCRWRGSAAKAASASGAVGKGDETV